MYICIFTHASGFFPPSLFFFCLVTDGQEEVDRCLTAEGALVAPSCGASSVRQSSLSMQISTLTSTNMHIHLCLVRSDAILPQLVLDTPRAKS